MDGSIYRCKSCGFVFDDVDPEIDKCTKKKLYCELCLAQKNPRSETEQTINKRYVKVTAISSVILLISLIVINWGKNKNDSFVEYIIVFGIGYLIIWATITILLLPVLQIMKKPHKIRIKKEKDRYIKITEEKKELRKTQQVQLERE